MKNKQGMNHVPKFPTDHNHNTKQQCDAVNCNNKRRGLSKYCGKHAGRLHQHGHIEGSVIRLKDYPLHVEMVEKFFQLNRTNNSIVLSEQLVTEWLQSNNDDTVAKILFEHKVPALEVLTKIATIYLIGREENIPQLKEANGMYIAIGHSVSHLVNLKGKRIPVKAKHAVGQTLLNTFHELCYAMKKTFDKRKLTIEQHKHAVRTASFSMDNYLDKEPVT